MLEQYKGNVKPTKQHRINRYVLKNIINSTLRIATKLSSVVKEEEDIESYTTFALFIQR